MKVFGWILVVFGALSAVGALAGGISPVGGIFFIVLGAYLLSRAAKKAKEQQEKDKWLNNN